VASSAAPAQAVCIAFFTLEAIARMLCCPNLRNYLSDAANIIDLAAIIPFYLELGLSGVPGFAVLRVVRLVRILRIFKVGAVQ
jgi:voltage-gated potassium channel